MLSLTLRGLIVGGKIEKRYLNYNANVLINEKIGNIKLLQRLLVVMTSG